MISALKAGLMNVQNQTWSGIILSYCIDICLLRFICIPLYTYLRIDRLG